MRYLILSDLHANWEALDAVIHEAAGRYDRGICCGDLIGYGADPNPVVDWARANCCITVRGNHDKASVGLDDLEWFNPVAKNAALWTQRTLTTENADWVRNLPTGPIDIEDFQILHGSPVDEDEYVIAATEAGQAFTYLQRRVAFFGHTHVQGGFIWNHSRVETIPRIPARSDRQVLEIDVKSRSGDVAGQRQRPVGRKIIEIIRSLQALPNHAVYAAGVMTRGRKQVDQ